MRGTNAALLASIPIFNLINQTVLISNLKRLFFFLLRVHLQCLQRTFQLIQLSILTPRMQCRIIEKTIGNIQNTSILLIRPHHLRLIFLQRALLTRFGRLHSNIILIWGILMIFLIIDIILINPLIIDFLLLTRKLLFICLEVGSHLGNHRERVVHLLLEVRVLIFQLIVSLLQLVILLFHFGVQV